MPDERKASNSTNREPALKVSALDATNLAIANLRSRGDGKPSVTLSEHGSYVLRILDPDITPYRPGTNRAKACQVFCLMNGLTVQKGQEILGALEPNIQNGRKGRPLGWIVNAVEDGYAEIIASR